MEGKKNVDIKSLKQMLDMIEKKVPMFIKFHSNGCGHCIDMMPEWQKLITTVNEKYKDKNIAIVAVEAGILGSIQAELNKRVKSLVVNGFPTMGTITYHNNGAVFKAYNKGRTKEEMLEEVNNLTGQSGGKYKRKRAVSQRKRTLAQRKRTVSKRKRTVSQRKRKY